MSEAAVLTAVQTALGQVTGITVTRQGWPLPNPWTGGIGVVLYVDPTSRTQTRLTNGPGGIVAAQYTICLRVILGAADTTPPAALAAAAPWDDRLRAACYPDPTFSGACFTSTLRTGQDNLTTFTRDQVHPAILWRLIVTEHHAANSGAS